jgi:hypothetical protein
MAHEKTGDPRAQFLADDTTGRAFAHVQGAVEGGGKVFQNIRHRSDTVLSARASLLGTPGSIFSVREVSEAEERSMRIRKHD